MNKIFATLAGLNSSGAFDKEEFARLEKLAYDKGWRLYGFGTKNTFTLCEINGDKKFKFKNLKQVAKKINELT